jgi:biopolymer transport protein ExbB/TolQ|tara:strand:+ start:158 stop:367 length:210 start_codon:yes stop_codon:yes gene_type:complete
VLRFIVVKAVDEWTTIRSSNAMSRALAVVAAMLLLAIPTVMLTASLVDTTFTLKKKLEQRNKTIERLLE